MRRLAGIIVAVLLLLAAASRAQAAKPISKCGTVTSGSYLLKKNLTGSPTQTACISVVGSYVTIDLGGYTITCNGNFSFGIYAPTTSGLIVRNGTIVGCKAGVEGCSPGGCFPSGLLVERVSVLAGRGDGIDAGEGSLVTESIIEGNANYGIFEVCPSGAIDNTMAAKPLGDLSAGPTCSVFNNLLQ